MRNACLLVFVACVFGFLLFRYWRVMNGCILGWFSSVQCRFSSPKIVSEKDCSVFGARRCRKVVV